MSGSPPTADMAPTLKMSAKCQQPTINWALSTGKKAPAVAKEWAQRPLG